MAATIPGRCIKCAKTGGILLCNGCNRTLCFEHVQEHKQEIDQNLENLIEQENVFEKSLLNIDDSHILFNEIDQWKKESIEQIKQIAKKTKDDLRDLLKQSNENLLKDLLNLKENVRLLKQSQDLSEIQLNRFTEEFHRLKSQINSFQLIKSSNSNYLKIEKVTHVAPPPPPPPATICKPIDKLLPSFEQIHSKKESSIIISEIDRYGHFIKIEHTGLTKDRDQDMCGWIFKRTIDPYGDIIYRFPNDFLLPLKSSVKILSRKASESIYGFESGNILIAKSIETWGIAFNTVQNRLIDPNGDEKDLLIETIK